MTQKIRVRTNNGSDSFANSLLADIQQRLNISSIKRIQTAKTYRFEGITKEEAEILSQKLLCESLNQEYSINDSLFPPPFLSLEITYKPGVMNPEVQSLKKAAHDLGIHPSSADSGREYIFYGNISYDMLEEIVKKLNLFNPLIEYIRKKDDLVTVIPLTSMNDEELFALSQDKLFLNLNEMKVIQRYFRKLKRNPTDGELETLAQTWSEHCAHKTFKANLIIDGKKKEPLFTRLKKEALKHNKHIVSAFIDNSGVMDFYEDLSICGKAETHNSPSAIEPYGGAATGSGGVFRDVLGTGQGAKTIVSTDIFCFAPPNMPLTKLPPGCLPPDYILKRVVTGVKDYGNRMGIPTNNGSLHFHEDFRAKPTVIVGAYGILPTSVAQKGKPKPKDVVITIGGKTGRDGIHGATFSSGEMTDKTISVNSSAVQIGNAIEEKRMFDAILEARDKGLIQAIQDCGAGGFSSAIGEMGQETGVEIHLEKAPLKYEGLMPWEIWVSESQERMVLALSPQNVEAFLAICKKYNVESCILGTFDTSKRLKVYYNQETVCDLDMQFLHEGLPKRLMKGVKPSSQKPTLIEPRMPYSQKDWQSLLEEMVSHGNICSKEPIVRLYDHTVGGTNVLQPFSGEVLDGPNDAAVVRPILDKTYGMVISHGLNPILNKIEPFQGSLWAIAEALANYVAVGGDYTTASLINNYIWPFPDEESLWSLDRCVDAVISAMKTFKIPVISGKDSLSSTYRGKDGTLLKIPPVLCMSVFGKIPDVSFTITSDLKKSNSFLYLVGKLDIPVMGGSTYFDLRKILGDQVPDVDISSLPVLFSTIHKAIQKKAILSCHDISEGGMFATLFEMCVGGEKGVDVSLNEFKNVRPDFVLFNETAGRFVVEIESKEKAEEIFSSVPHFYLGTTQKEKTIHVSQNSKALFTADLHKLKEKWQKPMKELFR